MYRAVAQLLAQSAAEHAERITKFAARGIEAIDRLRVCAENASRYDRDRIAELDEARALAVEAAKVERRATVRGAILGEGGKLVAVTFTKRDGTERTMKVQPAALRSRVKGEAATEAGRKATATRKASHPELLPVWDVEAGAVRSINLNTISRIAAGGSARPISSKLESPPMTTATIRRALLLGIAAAAAAFATASSADLRETENPELLALADRTPALSAAAKEAREDVA